MLLIRTFHLTAASLIVSFKYHSLNELISPYLTNTPGVPPPLVYLFIRPVNKGMFYSCTVFTELRLLQTTTQLAPETLGTKTCEVATGIHVEWKLFLLQFLNLTQELREKSFPYPKSSLRPLFNSTYKSLALNHLSLLYLSGPAKILEISLHTFLETPSKGSFE